MESDIQQQCSLHATRRTKIKILIQRATWNKKKKNSNHFSWKFSIEAILTRIARHGAPTWSRWYFTPYLIHSCTWGDSSNPYIGIWNHTHTIHGIGNYKLLLVLFLVHKTKVNFLTKNSNQLWYDIQLT